MSIKGFDSEGLLNLIHQKFFPNKVDKKCANFRFIVFILLNDQKYIL